MAFPPHRRHRLLQHGRAPAGPMKEDTAGSPPPASAKRGARAAAVEPAGRPAPERRRATLQPRLRFCRAAPPLLMPGWLQNTQKLQREILCSGNSSEHFFPISSLCSSDPLLNCWTKAADASTSNQSHPVHYCGNRGFPFGTADRA